MALSYTEAVNAISQFYNTNAANVWNVINDYNLTPEQAFNLVPNPSNFFNTGYGTINYANGQTASWNNFTQLSVQSGGSPLDSNIGTAVQTQYQIPTSTDYSGGSGNYFNGGQSLGNVSQGTTPIMTQVATGVAAAGLGISLGKVINQAAYNAGFNWLEWAGVNIESLNPETWDGITVDMSDTGFEGVVKRAFNAIFGISNDGSAQMYIDENAAAYLAMYMDKVGMFSIGDGGEIPTGNPYNVPSFKYASGGEFYQGSRSKVFTTPIASWERGYIAGSKDAYPEPIYGGSVFQYTYDNKNVYGLWYRSPNQTDSTRISPALNSGDFPFPSSYNEAYMSVWAMIYGGYDASGGIDGITDQTGATGPDFSNCETPTDYLNALRNQYPDLFNNAITQNVAQPDGTVIPHTYIPVGTPTATSTSDMYPTTDENTTGQSQDSTAVNPNNAPNPLIDGLVNLLTNIMAPTDTPPTTPTDTGEGNTPPAVIPTGSASALYSIYNPTQGELNSFGAWLWSSNFVDQLLKLFNDPMQAIIGLHKVFAAPVISGTSTIKVGYLDSGVSSNVVGNQYVTIDCGSVNISEYFGNVFDYDPFTQIYIYLPFVGIEKLDTGDVMRGVIGVKYHVDVLTGACLAEISVTRDGAGGILYTFAGNCAVQYPISSGSYMGIVASLASIAGGVVGTIASGGALAPVAMGAVNGVMNAHTRVNHSGAFSGNAGAMGVKIPYLIITRPQTCLADNFPAFDGYPANKTTSLSACSGFVKCETCHIENVPATDAELSEIEMLLKGGVII